ncbi:MAG: hypothetical protein AAGF19_06365, partial [Pseudomonadota bacterium]
MRLPQFVSERTEPVHTDEHGLDRPREETREAFDDHRADDRRDAPGLGDDGHEDNASSDDDALYGYDEAVAEGSGAGDDGLTGLDTQTMSMDALIDTDRIAADGIAPGPSLEADALGASREAVQRQAVRDAQGAAEAAQIAQSASDGSKTPSLASGQTPGVDAIAGPASLQDGFALSAAGEPIDLPSAFASKIALAQGAGKAPGQASSKAGIVSAAMASTAITSGAQAAAVKPKIRPGFASGDTILSLGKGLGPQASAGQPAMARTAPTLF